MSDKLRLPSEDDFPEDLESMSENDLQVLDSRIKRRLDHEVDADEESARETELSHEELDHEFKEREK